MTDWLGVGLSLNEGGPKCRRVRMQKGKRHDCQKRERGLLADPTSCQRVHRIAQTLVICGTTNPHPLALPKLCKEEQEEKSQRGSRIACIAVSHPPATHIRAACPPPVRLIAPIPHFFCPFSFPRGKRGLHVPPPLHSKREKSSSQ